MPVGDNAVDVPRSGLIGPIQGGLIEGDLGRIGKPVHVDLCAGVSGGGAQKGTVADSLVPPQSKSPDCVIIF